MPDEQSLRRKWTLHAHGEQVVFIKNPHERTAHVVMKALLWALYLPQYPGARVETRIGDRYKPDVVWLDMQGQPRFWAEAGAVSTQKIDSLARRFRDTHFAIGKWDANLAPLIELVSASLEGRRRTAPFDLITFPPDSAARFIDERGNIHITHDDLEWVRLGE